MKYNERIIKHNIDVPKLVPNGKINLTKIHYDKSVISHHPKSFEYYMIHGIVIDDIRYVVKEFFVRDNSVLAVVTPDENEYYEVVISNANSDEIDKLKKLIDDLAKSKANQDIDLNLNDRKLTVGDKSVTLPTDLQQLSLRGNKLSISGGNSVTLPEYDDISVKSRIEDLENRVDKDNQELSIVYDKLSIKNGNTVTLPKFNQNLNLSGRTLSISGGNSVTIPSDKQTISKNGNKIVLSNGGGEVDIPTATPYNDADIKRRLGVLEAKPDNDKQTLSISNNRLTISNGNSVDLPQPNLSGYVPIEEYNKLKGALGTLLGNLKTSGAWQQTGATIFEGKFYNGRNIATGNINVFGGTVDGYHFIKTSNNHTENDLAGGV